MKEKLKYVYKKYGYYNDKVELTLKYLFCNRKAEKKARGLAREIVSENRKEFLHVFWGYKKQVLKDDYNIEWRTPVELNPRIKFN